MTADISPQKNPWVVGVVLALYVAVIFGYPLVGDDDLNEVVFLLGWLGSSFLAGSYVQRRWMLAVPLAVGGVLIGVSMAGLSDSEFLSDPFSSIAITVFTGGEVVAMWFGMATASFIQARSNP